MSLFYSSEKWLMITFASVAITTTVGLVSMQYANGYIDPSQYEVSDPNLAKQVDILNNLRMIRDYCLEHYSEPFNNPVQDLIDMDQVRQEALDMFQGNNDCKVVQSVLDKQDLSTAGLIQQYYARGCTAWEGIRECP